MKNFVFSLIATSFFLFGCAADATGTTALPEPVNPGPAKDLPSLEPQVFGEARIWILEATSPLTLRSFSTDGEPLEQRSPPPSCELQLASVDYYVCKDDGRFSIQYLDNADEILLAESIPDWFTLSPQGEYVVFPVNADDSYVGVNIFDTKSGTSRRVAIENRQDENYFLHPTISSDGRYLVLGKGFNGDQFYFEVINIASQEIQRVMLKGYPSASSDLNWSPVENLFIFGMNSTASDVLFAASELYLLDLNDVEVKYLAESPEFPYRFFGENIAIWSPDGNQVALATEKQICIVDIKIVNQICSVIDMGIGMDKSPIWLPQENTILFYLIGPGPTGNLMRFDVNQQTYAPLIRDVVVRSFWFE